MPSKTTAFSHFLTPLAELNAPTTPRSWVLNGFGKAQFAMSTSDPKVTEQNLQFGNVLFIEHIPSKDENGATNGKLPNWVGMVLPSRSWDLGVNHKDIYTMESYLAYCPMPFVRLQGTPKQMFLEMIKAANEFINHFGGGIT